MSSACHLEEQVGVYTPALWMWPLYTGGWLDWGSLFLTVPKQSNHLLILHEQGREIPTGTNQLSVHSDFGNRGCWIFGCTVISIEKCREIRSFHCLFIYINADISEITFSAMYLFFSLPAQQSRVRQMIYQNKNNNYNINIQWYSIC